MRSFTSLVALSAGLVTAQDHLAVLGPDGVSVGYHADSPSLVGPPVDPDKAPSEVSITSQSLSLQSQPVEAHTPVPFPTKAIALQPVVVLAPTESPSIGQVGSASGTAPRSDGRCGTQFDNALCDPNGIYGGCCS
jgi:hypothetical protein